MASATGWVSHAFTGGWSTDTGINVVNPPQQQGFPIPFLVDAENVLFNLDGSVVKIPGTSKLNSTVMASGGTVQGIFDYWNVGVTGTAVQHRIVHVGTTIKKDDGDGTFTTLRASLVDGAIPSYAVLEDLLVMASDSNVPFSWDGTTFQALAGSPPDFAFCVMHQGRLWAAGVDAFSSRLYYSALLNGEDWIGAGSGEINIDPLDGDRITGLVSHLNELWVFKGPNEGSIHRITGSAPTGTFAFARQVFARGVGTVAHNTLKRFGTDIFFLWADGSVRSLSSTDRFGDMLLSTVSAPININYLNKQAKQSRLAHAQAAVDEIKGLYLLTITAEGATVNNVLLIADMRFSPPRWTKATVFTGESIASVIDSANNNQKTIMIGQDDGFVYRWNSNTKTHAGASIPFKVTTPFINYGSNSTLKTLNGIALLVPCPNANLVTIGWTRDGLSQQTQTITPAGGILLDVFLLDTDKLGGGQLKSYYRYAEDGGDFRAVQYQITQTVNESDFTLHSFEALLGSSGVSTEDELDT